MKIFLDTADRAMLERWLPSGIIDGVTTNPSTLSKQQAPLQAVKEICRLMGDRSVSVEVTESDPKAVYEQARRIADLSSNVAVKIPCHIKYYPVIKRLVSEGVRLNITLVFSVLQGLFMCKLGVAYISPFVGRLDDIDVPGIDLIAQLRTMVDNYFYETEVLAASMRSVLHVNQAAMSGADIATVPPALLEKMVNHILTDQGIEQFTADWKKLGNPEFL